MKEQLVSYRNNILYFEEKQLIMKKVIILLTCAAIFGCSQNAKKEGVPIAPSDTTKQENGSSEKAAAPMGKQNIKASKADELLPEVASVYSGIVVGIANVKTGTNTEIEVPFNTEVKIQGSPFAITVQSLFPDFIMVEGGVANKSTKEGNPGAKVIIKKGSEVAFDGWLFQKFPDAHGFEDPDYKVIMLKTSPKK